VKRVFHDGTWYKFVSFNEDGVLVDLPEKEIHGHVSRKVIGYDRFSIGQLRYMSRDKVHRSEFPHKELLYRLTGSTPRVKKLATPPSKKGADDSAKTPWRQQVKDMATETRHCIRQDKKDLAFAKKHNEFDTALKLQVIIEENESFLDSLTYLLEHCC
jgi:hypothetical protein